MTSIKDKILHDLQQATEPLSGQAIAERYEMSRTAIWKHIQKLIEEGHEITTVHKKGYVLVGSPDVLNEAAVTPYLKTKALGRKFIHLNETESTQLIAHQLVHETANGTVIVAESQTAGRGRMMREWDSAKGKGIWTTVILKPNVQPYQTPQFTLVAAVAVVNAIKKLYPAVDAKIKWPNDLLINGKKCTGILTEMVAETDRVHGLLIGIGINVNQNVSDFPEEIQSIATSLSLEVGEQLNRAELLAELLYYLEHYSDHYVQHGFSRLKGLWEEASVTIGKQIRATTLREVIEGRAIGITDNGVLQIALSNGEVKEVYSADIEIV